MWKLEESTLYDRVSRRLETEFEVVIVTFNAAIPGVCVALREGQEVKWVRGRRYEGLTTALTFRDTSWSWVSWITRCGARLGPALAVEMGLMDDQVRNCIMLL